MFKPVLPFSSRALILGVSLGARGHASLISNMVRVHWLTGFPVGGDEWEECCEYGLFPLINPKGGVRVWGWEIGRAHV